MHEISGTSARDKHLPFAGQVYHVSNLITKRTHD